MLTVFSEHHARQNGRAELIDGALKPCYETPRRAEMVLASIRRAALGEVRSPDSFGEAPLRRVHSSNYVEFLKRAWDMWIAAGRNHDALPLNWQVRGMRNIEPETIDGKLSYFSFDAGTPVTAGTWRAASAAVDVALTGVALLDAGEPAIFSLCRPPGHHAAADYFGGYCFLNNAAVAAQAFRDQGVDRVAVLDIDYHHGNGTQSIFYDRKDIFFASIHGNPEQEFPFFLGYADETGAGDGDGYNANFPLPWGTGNDLWFDALAAAIGRITHFRPGALVVSLGVDTYKDDPISQFRIESDDYLKIGARIAGLRVPTLFVMEGGYAVDAIGDNVVNVLRGFSGAP